MAEKGPFFCFDCNKDLLPVLKVLGCVTDQSMRRGMEFHLGLHQHRHAAEIIERVVNYHETRNQDKTVQQILYDARTWLRSNGWRTD